MNPFESITAEDPQAAPWTACAAAWAASLGGLTAVNYLGDARQFVAWLAGVAPWQINATHARLWSSALRDTHAPASLNRKMAALSSLYRYAAEQGLWPGPNPFDAPGLRMRVPMFGRSSFPNEDEVRRLLDQIMQAGADERHWRDFGIVFGLVATARRISEWLHIKWSDISEDGNGGHYFTFRAKGGRQRRQHIPDVLYLALARYVEAAGRTPAVDGYVFVPEGGDGSKSLSTQYVGRCVRHYGELAGIADRNLHLHGLRHFAARWRKEHGATVFELQDTLCHRLLQTTQVYTDAVLSTPVDRLADAVAGLLPASARRGLYKPSIMQPDSDVPTHPTTATGNTHGKGTNGDGTSK